jgi:hypothetical protein
MTIGKIKPTTQLIAQFFAGVEVEAINHDGKVFLPVINIADFGIGVSGETPTEPTPSSKKEKKSEPAPEPAPSKKAKKQEPADEDDDDDNEEEGGLYTEEELSEMSTKDLLALCKKMGIDPDATDGKNTNKKLRNLILEAQEEGDDSEGEEDEEGDETDYSDEVKSILEKLDEGKLSSKKALKAILALNKEADEDAVSELLTTFEDDEEGDFDDYAEKFSTLLNGGELSDDEDEDDDDEEDTSEPKGKEVDHEDLQKGDKVAVQWEDPEGWFKGVVKSTKKGKVVITYDDGTEEALDAEQTVKVLK